MSLISFASTGSRTVDINRAQACRYIDLSAVARPDIVCLPENFLHVGLRQHDPPVVEDIFGPTIEDLSEKARQHRTYVSGTVCTPGSTGGCATTAFLLDRHGSLVGRYEKVHPTIGEIIGREITPGGTIPVFTTDFGRVGFATCSDIGSPEHWEALAQRGAELVLWASVDDGGFPLRAYAWRHQYWIASAVRTQQSAIIDPTGRVIATTSAWIKQLPWTVDLDRQIFHVNYQEEKLARLLAERRNVRTEALPEEGIFTLESDDPGWPVSRLMGHYGLETYAQYHARATIVQDTARGVSTLPFLSTR